MSFRKLGIVLAVVMALGAVMASSALAAAVTEESHWNVAGTKLAAGESREVTCKSTERVGQAAGEKNLKFTSEVLGKKFVLTANNVGCIPNEGAGNAKIVQNEASAQAQGRLQFTGVSVDEPAGCVVPETLTTEKLVAETYMEGTNVYEKFTPVGEFFLKIPITKCAIESTPKVTGSSFGLGTFVEAGTTKNSKTGENRTAQMLSFSAAIETAAGGTLLLGPKPATLEGTVDNELVGGASFGAEK